jgi:hypothetical protein
MRTTSWGGRCSPVVAVDRASPDIGSHDPLSSARERSSPGAKVSIKVLADADRSGPTRCARDRRPRQLAATLTDSDRFVSVRTPPAPD